jgi:hypothetical protein
MRECNPVEQEARQRLLDELYHRSGRDRLGHPMRGLYTGLWQEWTQTAPAP